MNEIEKYINGELEPSERLAFETRLGEDPALQEEVQKWQSVASALTRLRIADKVKEVDAERRIWLRQRLIRRLITGVILAGLAGLAVFIYWGKSQTDPVHDAGPQEIQMESSPTQESPTPVDEESLPPAVIPKPIAEGPKNKSNAREKPMLRNFSPGLDSTTNQLIDALLKMTDYNTRSLNKNIYSLEGDWGKCLRALQQGQYQEAKKQIFMMEKDGGPAALEAQWLMGIALLEEGKPEEALVIFEKIAQNKNHPRYKDAQPAVEALR